MIYLYSRYNIHVHAYHAYYNAGQVRSSVDAPLAILQTEQVLTLKIIHKFISIRAGVLIFLYYKGN